MKPDPSDPVCALFEAALDLPSEERAPFVRSAPYSGEVRAKVLALLDRLPEDTDPDCGLVPELEDRLDGRKPLEGTTPSGHEVSFHVVDQIGSGGMGTVYKGFDVTTRQTVAIKIPRFHRFFETFPVDRYDKESFRREVALLSRLDHPNIVKLLASGFGPGGLPFVVTEYVNGPIITAHCKSVSPSLPVRLALFLDICAAVGAVHRAGIVHRDLKASNVRVNREGVVKLLDFGVAKRIDGKVADAMRSRKPTLRRFLSVESASPEQIREEAATYASDIYSLGVLLYQLLTGRPPHQLEGIPAAQAERIICEGRPLPPSRMVRRDVSVPARQVRPRLDAITLKALSKAAPKRHQSVGALIAEIHEALEDLRSKPNSWKRQLALALRGMLGL